MEYKTKELENAERQIDECMAKIQELKDANISKQQKVIELEQEIAELKATNNCQDQCRYVKPTQELEYLTLTVLAENPSDVFERNCWDETPFHSLIGMIIKRFKFGSKNNKE